MNEVILVFDCQNSYLLGTNLKLNVSSTLQHTDRIQLIVLIQSFVKIMEIDSYENVVLHTTIQEHILKDTNFCPAFEQLGNFPQHLPNLKFKSFVIRRNLSTFYMKASHFDYIILGVANVESCSLIIQFTFFSVSEALKCVC